MVTYCVNTLTATQWSQWDGRVVEDVPLGGWLVRLLSHGSNTICVRLCVAYARFRHTHIHIYIYMYMYIHVHISMQVSFNLFLYRSLYTHPPCELLSWQRRTLQGSERISGGHIDLPTAVSSRVHA